MEAWTSQAGLSPKYARSLWTALSEESSDRHLMRWLRQRWEAFPQPKNPAAPTAGEVQSAARALAADIRQLSRELCPAEPRLIIPDAGNGPIEHLDRRAKTAETRDTFDAKAAANSRFSWEFRNVADKPSFKLFVDISDLTEMKSGGFVSIDGSFTTNQRGHRQREEVVAARHRCPLRTGSTGESEFRQAPTRRQAARDGLRPRRADTYRTYLAEHRVPLQEPRQPDLHGRMQSSRMPNPGRCSFASRSRKTAARDDRDFARPLVDPRHAAAFASSGTQFCKLFPNRFIYVDPTRGVSAGFHLIEGFFRDDQPLYRNVLSDAEQKELDGLWKELYFVTGIWEKMLRGFVFFERSERNFLKHRDFDSFKEEDPDLVKDETLLRFKEVYLKRSNVKATGADLAKHPISVFFDDVRTGSAIRPKRSTRCRIALPSSDLLAFAEKAYRRPLYGNRNGRSSRGFTSPFAATRITA